MSEVWREFRDTQWEGIRKSTLALLAEREAIGRRNYGSGGLGGSFRGDPITHLEDEIGDTLAYLYFIRRQRESLESQIAEYEAAIAKRNALLNEARFLFYVSRFAAGPEVWKRAREFGKQIDDLIEAEGGEPPEPPEVEIPGRRYAKGATPASSEQGNGPVEVPDMPSG